tara:strand:+ start:189 stop:1454 length:1266 start_codon:yes stop_codon:yes gene_type:complete
MAELLFDQLSPEEKEDVVSFYNSQNMNIGSPLTDATLPTNQRSWRDDAVFEGGSSTSPDPELVRQGTQGAIVNTIQEALNNNGADLIVDGVAGPRTLEAAAEFQRNTDGLIPDGRIGAQTIGALMSPRLDSKGETVPIPTWQKALGKPIFNNGSFSQTKLSEAISNSGIATEESAILRGAFETEVGNSGPITESGYTRQNTIDKGPNSAWGRRMVRDGVMNADGTLTDLYSAENVFNSVYSNNDTGLGNGDFASGDGSKFKGRGLIQITGRNNYQEVQNRLSALGIEVDIMSNPDLVNDEKYALPAALAFLDYAGINESTIPTMSAKGLNNAINSNAPVATAEERWENVIDILREGGEETLATAVSNRNEYAAQRTVGTSVDGDIGPNSVTAIRGWLTRNNVDIPEDATNLDLVRLVNENS